MCLGLRARALCLFSLKRHFNFVVLESWKVTSTRGQHYMSSDLHRITPSVTMVWCFTHLPPILKVQGLSRREHFVFFAYWSVWSKRKLDLFLLTEEQLIYSFILRTWSTNVTFCTYAPNTYCDSLFWAVSPSHGCSYIWTSNEPDDQLQKILPDFTDYTQFIASSVLQLNGFESRRWGSSLKNYITYVAS